MYQVKWLKIFTGGILNGLTFDAQLTFASLDDASRYVAFLHEHAVNPITRNSSPYTCHAARIVSI